MFNWFKKIFSWFKSDKVQEVIEGVVSQIPVKEEPEERLYPHGRLLEWFTPQGKRVVVHADGCFEGLHWQNEAELSWEGICCLYTKKYPNATIDEVEIEGTETRINNYITKFDPHGKYLDDGSVAKVPNGIQHYIRTRNKDTKEKSSYYLEFEYNNERDAIISLGGLYVINGDEGFLNVPAQRRQSSDCNGKRTYLR